MPVQADDRCYPLFSDIYEFARTHLPKPDAVLPPRSKHLPVRRPRHAIDGIAPLAELSDECPCLRIPKPDGPGVIRCGEHHAVGRPRYPVSVCKGHGQPVPESKACRYPDLAA